MPKTKINISVEKLFKVLIGVLAVTFLLYTIFTFKEYERLKAYFMQNALQWDLLLLVVLLVPANWYLESIKWKTLLKGVQSISLQTAFYSVLAGLTTAILSPARLGEFAGRIWLLRPENRKKAGFLWAVGSMTMTIAIILAGIPAVYFYFQNEKQIDFVSGFSASSYIQIIVISVISLLLLYFFIPRFMNVPPSKITRYFTPLLSAFKHLSFSGLWIVLLLSTVRYLLFCIQFRLMLGFFGIELSTLEAYVGICTAYLFITCIPSAFFTEAVVKSSIFLLVLSSFTSNSIAIVGTSMSLWLLNVAVPTLLGVFFLQTNPKTMNKKPFRLKNEL